MEDAEKDVIADLGLETGAGVEKWDTIIQEKLGLKISDMATAIGSWVIKNAEELALEFTNIAPNGDYALLIENNDDIDPQEEIISEQDLLLMIQSLPDGYRMVFNLYAIEDYSHKQIAEMLKISESTSKTQLFKARNLLQKKIQIFQSNKVIV